MAKGEPVVSVKTAKKVKSDQVTIYGGPSTK